MYRKSWIEVEMLDHFLRLVFLCICGLLSMHETNEALIYFKKRDWWYQSNECCGGIFQQRSCERYTIQEGVMRLMQMNFTCTCFLVSIPVTVMKLWAGLLIFARFLNHQVRKFFWMNLWTSAGVKFRTVWMMWLFIAAVDIISFSSNSRCHHCYHLLMVWRCLG